MNTRFSRTIPAACILFASILVEMSLVTGLVSGPTFQRIFDLTDTQLGVALSAALGGVFFVSGLFSPFYWLTLLSVALGALLSSPVGPCIMSLPRKLFRAEKARVLGYYQASLALAGLAGPSLVGSLADAGVRVWVAVGISPLAAFAITALSVAWMKSEPVHGEE